jgi:hypothetical protein
MKQMESAFKKYTKSLQDSQTWYCKLIAKGYVSKESYKNCKNPDEVDICPLMSNQCLPLPWEPLLANPLSHFMFDPKEVKGFSQESISRMINLISAAV